MSWIHVLKSGTLDASKTRHVIDVIERNTLLQARLIDDLLDVSRAVAGKLDFVVERLDMTAVVQQVVHAFEPKAQAAGLAMETATTAGLFVLGDAVRLQQVVGSATPARASMLSRSRQPRPRRMLGQPPEIRDCS